MKAEPADATDECERLEGPIDKLAALLPRCIGPKFDKDVYTQTGIYVIRGLFTAAESAPWLGCWSNFYDSLAGGREVNRFNPVAFNEAPPDELRSIYRNSSFLDVAEQIFGPNLALYNFRLVIKDKHSRGPVFRHQDICYHVGHFQRASFFVPLSKVGRQNGGLTYFLGTHKFGYLGDAGELREDIIPGDWPRLTPDLDPGDLAIMDSSLWHESGPHLGGEDRVLVDIHVQPASDPSGLEILRGKRDAEYRIPHAFRGKVFKRSRVTRLAELQGELEELKKKQC